MTYGITGSIDGVDLGVQDSAIIFNTEGQDVFSSLGVTGGKSKLPFSISTEVAVGWLEDTEGNIVTNPQVIKEQMPAFSYGASVSVGLGKSRYSNLDGYKFYTQLLNPNANLSFGISWTKYLGTKDDVAKGVIK